jgi:hypothetical protein
MQEELRSERDAEMTTGSAVATAAPAPAPKEAPATPVGRLERVPAFASYNLGSQFYPRFASAYFDRGVTPYRMRTSDRPLTDVTASRRAADAKRTRTAAPMLRRPLMIVPVLLPERREPVTAALTP